MQAPTMAYNHKLISVIFYKDSKEDTIETTIKTEHKVRNDDKRAEYIPTVTMNSVYMNRKQKCSLRIVYQVSFIFDNPKSINEADLFGCIKKVCETIEGFISHNLNDFGRLKINPESATILPDLYEVVKTFHT